MDIQRIGFVGLGTMGAPMARNLVAAGYAVQAFDVNPAAIQRFSSTQTPTCSPLDAAMGTDVVVTMLPNGPDVENAVLGPDGAAASMRPGSILIDMSTISPATTRKIGAALSNR